MEDVRQLIAKSADLPEGRGDRFSGYAVMGVTFSSGNVLALRCFGASSVGPAYTSVWHRDPGGGWTFHQNVPPGQSCPRYFGAAIDENTTGPIRIEWTGPREFRVTVEPPGDIVWDVRLSATFATRAMNAVARMLPSSWWEKKIVLQIMGACARWVLGTGKMQLTGLTPNGQRFTASPRTIWRIDQSRAVIRGVDAGSPAPLAAQASLGDFRIPQRGIFALADAVLEGQVDAEAQGSAAWLHSGGCGNSVR
jgi:hypothetical protein